MKPLSLDIIDNFPSKSGTNLLFFGNRDEKNGRRKHERACDSNRSYKRFRHRRFVKQTRLERRTRIVVYARTVCACYRVVKVSGIFNSQKIFSENPDTFSGGKMAVRMPPKFIIPEKFSEKFEKLSFSSDYEVPHISIGFAFGILLSDNKSSKFVCSERDQKST